LAEEAGGDRSLLGVHSYKEVVEKLAQQLPEDEHDDEAEFDVSESSESESSESETDEAKR
jgi:hypothetical protein